MTKVLIISGPTASGKTALALELAKKFNGELVSADSRQVYQGMDIVTGKDIGNSIGKIHILQTQIQKSLKRPVTVVSYEMEGVSLWGLDLVKPDQEFDVSMFLMVAQIIIRDITSRGKLPIIVGGTGFYIRALLHPMETIGVPVNKKLRSELDVLSVDQLQHYTQTVDPERWEQMNSSDRNNPRRLVRAIEVGSWKQKMNKKGKTTSNTNFHISVDDCLWLGLKTDVDTLEHLINNRIEQRIHNGALDEVKRLLEKGFSWQLPSMSAIGYKEWQDYINEKCSLEETKKLWLLHELQYAKRQITWFNKEKSIIWFDVKNEDYKQKTKLLVQKWLLNE